MSVDTGRPSQKLQKSRKGKKAWRKNIDLDQFEQNLDDQRDQEIVMGPEAPLFTVDKVGSDEGLTPKMKQERRLKSHEILHARSEVPALISQHKKKDKAPHKVLKDRHKLLERAGFTDKSKTLAELERDGLLKSSEPQDLWGSEPKVPVQKSKRSSKVRQAPEAPLPGTPAIDLPSGGQSYNPALEEWKATILREHGKLLEEETKRIKAEEEQARIDAIIAETEAKLNEPEDEEESEGSEVDAQEIGKLSVNPPTALKRKTKAERNRIRRHKIRVNELAQLKQKKQFMQKLAAEAQSKVSAQQSAANTTERAPKQLLRAHSKHPMTEEPLAVKLSDELDDSLRRLKPEGNLIKERMRSLQARGIIEARLPVKKPKNRSKMVEKWSFKHFK